LGKDIALTHYACHIRKKIKTSFGIIPVKNINQGGAMAKYKRYSYQQAILVPVNFHYQIIPGSFEYALNHIVDNELNLSVFAPRYNNDETGAPAYDPKILIKIILYAYSRGITSSRDIEQLCDQNVVFIALSADTHPHFTTIAGFISAMKEQILPLFRDVLLYCQELNLIDKTMFAIDGCKISSNASKEWSGTHKDYERKIEKLEKTIKYILEKHAAIDLQEGEKPSINDEQKHIENIRKKIDKIKRFISTHQDKQGAHGHIKKSNITDNESAKIPSSKGVIQGYNGVAVADAKCQVIVHAQAFGQGQEKDLLQPMVEGAKDNFQAIGDTEDIFKKAKLIADTGYFAKINLQLLDDENIDGYIPDHKFRKRDPRFNTAFRHDKPIDKTQTARSAKYFQPKDFKYDHTLDKMICPAGKPMYIRNSNYQYKGSKAVAYMARTSDCRICPLRVKCIRKQTTTARQVHIFYERKDSHLLKKMREKIDSDRGRYIYSQRMKIIEPVFANIRSNLGLDYFSLRGQTKVDIQWKLFAIIHNIRKIYRYGTGFA
jgi:transposase